VKRRPVKQRLFDCAETDDLNGLKRIAYFSSKEEKIDWNCTNGAMTLLQLASTHGNERIVEFLLQREDIDVNLAAAGEPRHAISQIMSQRCF
jgi:hypothetical protein